MQALVRERMKDWGQGMCRALGKKMVELTGDYTPDLRALLSADVIIATPEKWDGISRAWQNRGYVQKVALLVIDEIHLLGADRCALEPQRRAQVVLRPGQPHCTCETLQFLRSQFLPCKLPIHVLASFLLSRGSSTFNAKP